MATLDPDLDEIVIRVVYDGPPLAGKTTSLRALSGSLSQPAVTPQEDGDGRTLWFDWMEYAGGRYEGCRIRCQVVSVPGQLALAARRRVVLEDADVVVMVADSRASAWEQSRTHLANLRRELAAAPEPAPGVVLQLNKRDLPDALALDELRAQIDAAHAVGVIESVAADGTGIREGFIYAVRLALDRVRELMMRGELRRGGPSIASPDQLLARMQETEAEAVVAAAAAPIFPPLVERGDESLAATLFREVLAQETAAAHTTIEAVHMGRPRPPDAMVPSGAIWPPVEGRAMLYEVSRNELVSRPVSTGAWAAGLGSGWRLVSGPNGAYHTLDQGRAALVQWARLHALSLPVISPRRCIVLGDAGDGTWRLWQIVRAEESLRDLLAQAFREPGIERMAAKLYRTAQLLVEAEQRFTKAPCVLPCNLDSIGQSSTTAAVYVGLMPEVHLVVEPERRAVADAVHELVRAQIGPLVQHELGGRYNELHAVFERMPQFIQADSVLSTLTGMIRELSPGGGVASV